MKIVSAPSITDLDGLLDLILRPDKGIQYLKDLQAMQQSIADALGLLTTKDKADTFLIQAEAKMQESVDAMASAQEYHEETEAQRKAMVAEIQALKQAHEQKTAQHAAKCQAKEKALEQREQDLASALAEVTAQRLSVMALSESLNQKKHDLDAREAKLKNLKLVMGEAGI